MRLHTEHDFAADAASVIDVLLDPDFVTTLTALPDVGSVEIVARDVGAAEGTLAMRLTYDGSVDGIAAKVLGSGTPSWVQTYRFDLVARSGDLTISPDVAGNLFDCAAAVSFEPTDEGCRRVVDGTLAIRIPLVGGKAERSLGPAILARIDTEADLVDRWLNR